MANGMEIGSGTNAGIIVKTAAIGTSMPEMIKGMICAKFAANIYVLKSKLYL